MMGLFDNDGFRFKTKKMLKEYIGQKVVFQETSFFGAEFKGAGSYTVVLPSPTERKAFATVIVRADGTLLKVN